MAAAAMAQTTTLRVSAIPDEAPTELQRKFAPLGDYLAKETGCLLYTSDAADE